MEILQHADILYKEGQYALACEILTKEFITTSNWEPNFIFLFARTLKALSRYKDAANILLLARKTSDIYARSLILRAEIAWLTHQYAEGYACALEALRLNMFDRHAQLLRDRCRIQLESKLGNAEDAMCHVAFYMGRGGNFGDIVLPQTIRDCIHHFGMEYSWNSLHVHQLVDEKRLSIINSSKGLIIGGGGLFLPDTSPNGNSGWQWNISSEMLNKIDVPIAVTAVGYNLFYNQEISNNIFKKSLQTLVDKATVFGLRNYGSINAVKDLLPNHLRDKVQYMPCPTTIISLLYPEFSSLPVMPEKAPIFLNLAFDRFDRRFQGRYDQVVKDFAIYITELKSQGLTVEYAAHLPSDERFVKDLEEAYGIRLRVHGLYDMSIEEGYSLYRKAALVIGMRGHSSMIPFGLGIPIVSIISHPKMLYFLEDIGKLEWGIHIQSPHFGKRLLEVTLHVIENNSTIRKDIIIIKEKLYKYCGQIVDIFNNNIKIDKL